VAWRGSKGTGRASSVHVVVEEVSKWPRVYVCVWVCVCVCV
jgi:hypothetical protein